MAVPRPGSKAYKGPVHESVRGALEMFGIKTFGKVTRTGSPPPGVKTQTLADRKVIAKGNMRNATAGSRNRGSYYSYDPLSSVSAPAGKAKKVRKPLNQRLKYRRIGGKGDT